LIQYRPINLPYKFRRLANTTAMADLKLVFKSGLGRASTIIFLHIHQPPYEFHPLDWASHTITQHPDLSDHGQAKTLGSGRGLCGRGGSYQGFHILSSN
jgi:hypothetical protein